MLLSHVWYCLTCMVCLACMVGMVCLGCMVCLVCMAGMVCMACMVGIVWMVSVGYFDMSKLKQNNYEAHGVKVYGSGGEVMVQTVVASYTGRS